MLPTQIFIYIGNNCCVTPIDQVSSSLVMGHSENADFHKNPIPFAVYIILRFTSNIKRHYSNSCLLYSQILTNVMWKQPATTSVSTHLAATSALATKDMTDMGFPTVQVHTAKMPIQFWGCISFDYVSTLFSCIYQCKSAG